MRCFEFKISSRASYELMELGNLFCKTFPRLRTLNINSGSAGMISNPKETEGENTDIFNFCFFSSFYADRQPF